MSAGGGPAAAGRLGWIDVTTFDLTASAPFFERLFGWEREELELPQAPGYSFLRGGGEVVAGIDPVPVEKGPPQWTVFVLVADCARALAAIEQHAGGIALAPEPVLDQGTIALGRDPAGAGFGLWQAGAMVPARSPEVPGRLAGAELRTPDPAGAAAFYAAVFGWTEGAAAAGGGLALDAGVPVAIEPGEGAAAWTPWLGVPDLDAALARALELGARLEREDGPAPILAGPEGARFGLCELAG